MAFIGAQRALLSNSTPQWARGFDLWADYTVPRGNGGLLFPPGTDTHAQTIYAQQATNGPWQSFAANVPTRTALGLQTVPTRQQLFINPNMAGASAGSPGTIPTGWAVSAAGLTQTISLVTVNGIPCITFRFNGTTGATSTSVTFTSSRVAISPSATYVQSALLALYSGSLSNINAVQIASDDFTSGGAYSSSPISQSASITSTPLFFSGTGTTSAAAATINSRLVLSHSSGVPIDITILIGAPQLTSGSFPVPPILTGSATVNGNQQVIDLTGKLGSGVGGILQVNFPTTSGINFIYSISDGTTSNRMVLTVSGGNLRMFIVSGGLTVYDAPPAGAFSAGGNTIIFAMSSGYNNARLLGQSALGALAATYPLNANLMGIGGRGYAADANSYQITRRVAIATRGGWNDASFGALYSKAQLMASTP